MVDPICFTNYNHTISELEEKILFSVLVAGKNALTTARCLDRFLPNKVAPFSGLRHFSLCEIRERLHDNGIGCHNSKGKSVYELVHSNLDLQKCSVDELTEIHGIGPKTARMYVLHTRKDAEVAVLDVHILKYLKNCGYNVPKHTPSGRKYKEIEKQFLELAKESGQTVAEFDLSLWNKYRKK